MGIVTAPRSFSKTQLEKVGIEIVTSPAFFLKCVKCGRHWSVKRDFRNRLPRGYWKCSRGCNC